MMMDQVIALFSDHASAQDQILLDRRFWITVFMAIAILPLSFLRKLDSLKYTSVVALIAVVYLCAIVVYYFFTSLPVPPSGEPLPEPVIELVSFTTAFFRRLPVFIFAFTCHQNVSLCYSFIVFFWGGGRGYKEQENLTIASNFVVGNILYRYFPFIMN